MLLGVFKVQETRVKDIMIPRSNMVIIKKNSSIGEILPLIIKSSHSRFPVILENKDEVVKLFEDIKNLLITTQRFLILMK